MRKRDMIRTVIICSIYIMLTLAGMSLIKIGNAEGAKGISLFGVTITPVLILGVFLYGLSFLVFTFWISQLQISLVIPVVSGIYCGFTVVIGHFLFNESINAWQYLGIMLVIIGTFIIGGFRQ